MTTTMDTTNCPGCAVTPGQNHGEGCDHARCPECGEQAIMCGETDRPAVWPGVDQRAEVAQQLGWWTTVAGIDHLVENYTRVLFADALGQIRWNSATQRYEIGDVDEAELDRKMRQSGCA